MGGTAAVAPVAITAAEKCRVLPLTSTLFLPVNVALPCEI